MAKKYDDYSVLMSVYGKEKPEFLRESMQSMYDQTVPTNDFVLICDGPLTDGLNKVIDEMQGKFGKRLRVIRQKKNMGLGYSLNHGVKECKNELIARMDSDDISVKDRIERQFVVFEKTGADVVGGNISEYDEDMVKLIGHRIVPQRNNEIVERIKKRNPVNHMTVVLKKSKVIKVGNYLDMPFFEDYCLWARMLKNNYTFFNIQDDLVKVRGGFGMVERRGGARYIRPIVSFQNYLLKLGLISHWTYVSNIIVRIIVSILPSRVRCILYMKKMRD